MARPSLYERWLMPERPGMRQFLIAVVAWLSPLAFLSAASGDNPRALIASVVVGCGLGLGWCLATGWRWLQAAPVSTVVVLATCFASASNLEMVPRWDAAVLAHRAITAALFYIEARTIDGSAPAPSYSTGEGTSLFTVREDAAGRLVCLFTSEPIRRWSVRGWRDACYVLVLADSSRSVLHSRADLDHALAPLTRGAAP